MLRPLGGAALRPAVRAAGTPAGAPGDPEEAISADFVAAAADRPCMLWTYLAATAPGHLPPQGPSPPVELPRANLVLEQLAPLGSTATGQPGGARQLPQLLDEASCVPYDALHDRPVWLPNGTSISEAALAGHLAARRRQPDFAGDRTPFNEPLAVDRLRLNRAVMWRSDCWHYDGAHPVHRAALQGDVAALQAALPAGRAEINRRRGPDGATPLILAAKWGHADAVTALLALPEMDVDMPDAQGASALWHACDGGHRQIVGQLLDRRADPNVVRAGIASIAQPTGATPLIAALVGGHCAIVRLLWQRGAQDYLRTLVAAPLPRLAARHLHPPGLPGCTCHALLTGA